jgi:ParB-like chromosome segregation protein Spo0J
MIHFHEALADLMVPAATITPDPRNANNGDIDEIIASLLTNGCYRPIYASKETGQIVAGHHLYAALLELGAQMVPVIFLDGDDHRAVRIMLADNRTAALAKMDEGLLLDLLRLVEHDLPGTGYDDRYLMDLLAKQDDALADPPAENLLHDITCPNCGFTFRRAQGQE